MVAQCCFISFCILLHTERSHCILYLRFCTVSSPRHNYTIHLPCATNLCETKSEKNRVVTEQSWHLNLGSLTTNISALASNLAAFGYLVAIPASKSSMLMGLTLLWRSPGAVRSVPPMARIAKVSTSVIFNFPYISTTAPIWPES